MKTVWLFAGLLAVAVPASVTLAPVASAQDAGSHTSLASLPPALRAAVISGNTQMIAQAITTLSGGNAQRTTTLANQVANVALNMLTTNPHNAVNLAAAAVNAVDDNGVESAAPNGTLNVLNTAAKIIVTPAAQQADAQSVGRIAVAVTRIGTTPAIYHVDPKAALAVMALAHTAATSQAVKLAMPQAASTIATTLTQAAKSGALNGVNPGNPAAIARILGGTQVSDNNGDDNENDLSNSTSDLLSFLSNQASPK